MKNAIIIKLLAFTLLAIIINACKKTDPDCDTCPCPACPRITEILPNHGRPGDTLILNGINFNEDPFLNIVTINDTLVQEILEGTTTQLKVVVPEGATTGPVRIRINDDKALSSDEIPDFNEPVFTFDHYVELVAGIPKVQGDGTSGDDGAIDIATFFNIRKIAIDDINKNIYVIDFNTSSKRIRKVDSTSVSTLYSPPSDTGLSYTNTLSDLTSSSTDKIYFIENTSVTLASKIRSINSTSILGNLVSSINLGTDYSFYGPHLFLDQNSATVFYLKYRAKFGGFPIPSWDKKYYICKRKLLLNGVDPESILATFSDTSMAPKVDMEYKNGYLYYFKGSATNSSLVKRQADSSSQEIILKSGIVEPGGLAIDKSNRVYYSARHQIYRLENGGQSILIAGSSNLSNADYNTEPSTGLNSLFNTIMDIDFDTNNNLYIVDSGNYCIRRLKID
jgi:hypothetical protein